MPAVELRWVVFGSDPHARRLQYRCRDAFGWTDWKDVPFVEEAAICSEP